MPSTAGRIVNRRTALKQAVVVGSFTVGVGGVAGAPGKPDPKAGGLLLTDGRPRTDEDFFVVDRSDEPPEFPTDCRAPGQSGAGRGYDRVFIEYEVPPPGGRVQSCAIHENKPLREGAEPDYVFVNPRPCSTEDDVWVANFRPERP